MTETNHLLPLALSLGFTNFQERQMANYGSKSYRSPRSLQPVAGLLAQPLTSNLTLGKLLTIFVLLHLHLLSKDYKHF